MGIIRIMQGQEFKYIRNCFGKDDVFLPQYKLAARCAEEIVRFNSQAIESEECLNNIIAFTGDRGQGKTSAMLTFTGELIHKKDKSDIGFGEKTQSCQFYELELIDPSTFEDMHNVVEVVVTKMYNAYMEAWHGRKKSSSAETYQEPHHDILKSFQAVYEGLSLVRNPRKFDDLEQDYEGTIAKIARAGDSAKLKKNMKRLVDQYLGFFSAGNGNNDRFLILPIDDLDVNITLAYKMMEQIRKYLILPNVILIMAVKADQLQYCVELQFRREMALLIGKEHRIIDQEPIDMATKYVAKLIPDARKIVLPQLRLLVGEIEEQDPFDVEYLINGENLFAKSEIMDKNCNYTFEARLLTKIYEYTGLVFVRSEKQVHPLVPQTLRELVNFVSVIGKMQLGAYLRNLEIFEDYFLNTWVTARLDDGYVRNIRSLFEVQTPVLHLTLCGILLDKLENLTAYTLDTLENENKDKTFNSLKKSIREKAEAELSMSDVIGLLNFLENHYTDQKVKLFTFSVRTIYSIIMRKMALNEKNNELIAFVGGSVLGRNVVPSKNLEKYIFSQTPRIDDMVQSNASEGSSRVNFAFNSKAYLEVAGDYLSKAAMGGQSEKIFSLLFFCSFSGNFKYFTSANGGFDKKPKFLLDNLFISPLYDCNKKFSLDDSLEYYEAPDHTPQRAVISKVTTNLELLEFLYKYCSDRKDPRQAATDAVHIRHFLNNLNIAAKEYLFEELFDHECINWVVTSFERFWACRIAADSILNSKKIELLYNKITSYKLGRACEHRTFQQRIEELLKLYESAGLSGLDDVRVILNQLEELLSISTGQDNAEKIDKTLRVSYNDCIDSWLNMLAKILNTKGDEA